MTYCPVCDYDWPSLPTHQASGLCEANIDIRIRVKTQVGYPIGICTLFKDLIDQVGLELWESKEDPNNYYAPAWVVRICESTWLEGHRVWILKRVATDGPLQRKLGKAKQINPYLYQLLMEKTHEKEKKTRASASDDAL